MRILKELFIIYCVKLSQNRNIMYSGCGDSFEDDVAFPFSIWYIYSG